VTELVTQISWPNMSPVTGGKQSSYIEGHSVAVVAAAFLAIALLFFFAAFLRADFNFRLRIAFFVVALRLPDMGIPLVTAIAGTSLTVV